MEGRPRVVMVLDRRIVDRSYGRWFLASLPPARRVRVTWSEMLPRIAGFLGRRSGRRFMTAEATDRSGTARAGEVAR